MSWFCLDKTPVFTRFTSFNSLKYNKSIIRIYCSICCCSLNACWFIPMKSHFWSHDVIPMKMTQKKRSQSFNVPWKPHEIHMKSNIFPWTPHEIQHFHTFSTNNSWTPRERHVPWVFLEVWPFSRQKPLDLESFSTGRPGKSSQSWLSLHHFSEG